MPIWIDTHCHLHALDFKEDLNEVVVRARLNHVNVYVIPAVHTEHFSELQQLAHQLQGGCYTLGIHPLYVHQSHQRDLEKLKSMIEQNRSDVRLVGIGEIGLDGFVKDIDWQLQQYFFEAQCRLARDFDLPVLCHVRRAQDQVLATLKRFGLKKGIAHAFNGSFQQAQAYIKQGFHLGFGGAWTFTRALQLRRLAAQLPLPSVVLETDSPDLSPQWWDKRRNEPAQLARIGLEFAQLREMEVDALQQAIYDNSLMALPGLKTFLDHENGLINF